MEYCGHGRKALNHMVNIQNLALMIFNNKKNWCRKPCPSHLWLVGGGAGWLPAALPHVP